MQILSALLALSFEQAQGWVASKRQSRGNYFRREWYFESYFEFEAWKWGKVKLGKVSSSLENKELLQEHAASHKTDEFCILNFCLREIDLNTAHFTLLKLMWCTGVLFFLYIFLILLRKSKYSKAISCPWGSVGRTTKERHGAKKFQTLPGTYWSPQLTESRDGIFGHNKQPLAPCKVEVSCVGMYSGIWKGCTT